MLHVAPDWEVAPEVIVLIFLDGLAGKAAPLAAVANQGKYCLYTVFRDLCSPAATSTQISDKGSNPLIKVWAIESAVLAADRSKWKQNK